MKKPELLAPAGGFDSLKAAINNGADAVYLGLGGFNARANATNFSKDNIREAVSLAHLFGVKVYCAFNTVISYSEIPELLELARAAVEAKADAFIVQDIGIAAILRRCFPGICLHASTQMGIHNLYGAKIARKLGIKRVILSRETKLEDIKAIKENTDLEIEFFVQGALCVAFSGGCYMSALEHNQSGNRGKCLQLCRLPYSAGIGGKKAGEGYLLSPSDLCLIENLKLLADSGVSAFKIEGRLRRAGYVAEAVSCYRKAIDGGFPPSGEAAIERLKKVFYRGEYIKNAYLEDGTPDRIINKEHQAHIGIPIGTVESVKPFKDIFEIIIKSKHPLIMGDGIKFFGKNGETSSMGAGNVICLAGGRYKVFGKVQPAVGARVNLISDKAAEDAALSKVKKIPVSLSVTAIAGIPLSVEADCGGISVFHSSGYIVQTAQSSPATREQIEESASKSGDTHFVIEKTRIDCGNVFIPKSVINEARRSALSKLEAALIEEAEKGIMTEIDEAEIQKTIAEAKGFAKAPKEKGIYQSNIDGSGYFAGENTAVLYPSDFTPSVVKKLAQKAIQNNQTPCLRLPMIANGKDIKILETILEHNKEIKTLLINNLYGFAFADRGYEIIAGWGINICNTFALKEAVRLGAYRAIESAESDSVAAEGKVYQFTGKGLPMMTLAHCPYKTLYGNTCENCAYKEGLSYSREKKTYNIARRRIYNCYFELIAE